MHHLLTLHFEDGWQSFFLQFYYKIAIHNVCKNPSTKGIVICIPLLNREITGFGGLFGMFLSTISK